jgi:hypothetical protein
MVNPEALTTFEIIEEMKKFGFENNNWKFIDLQDLKTITAKSNTVISTLASNNPMKYAPSELDSLRNSLRTALTS